VNNLNQRRGVGVAPRLTIVMPMKGRRLFTFRFLSYANYLKLPYRFIIADGFVDESAATYLENSRQAFPHLDVEYVRYPVDTNYTRFFAKMSDAMSRVRTPYVMQADNDDFPGFYGIERALDFLDAHYDYVCARGHQLTFTIYSHLGGSPGAISGRLNSMEWDNDAVEASEPTGAERLRQVGLCHRFYYAIYRRDVLALIWREMAEIDFSDLMLHEDFFGLRVLTLGKAHFDPATISYYSQAGSGISFQPMQDWAAHLLRSRFTSEANEIIERIGLAVSDGNIEAAVQMREFVRAILTRRYSRVLTKTYGPGAQVKRRLRERWPRLATGLQTRPRLSAGREEASILKKLQQAGAAPKDLDRVAGELAVIKKTLSPAALPHYAGPFLPKAQGADAAEWLTI